MDDNRYATAGWASIAAAAIFPLAFILEGLHEVIGKLGDVDLPVGVGPEDTLFLLFAVLSIYILKTLKSLMFDYYSFREVGTIINIIIFWTIVFYGGSFVLELLLGTVWPQEAIGLPLVLLVFWIVCVAVFGILDIVFGVMLLRQGRRFSLPIRVLAYLTLATGFFEATVILSALTLLLVPASYIALAFVFLRKVEDLEFV